MQLGAGRGCVSGQHAEAVRSQEGSGYLPRGEIGTDGRVRSVENRRVEVAGMDEMEHLVPQRDGRLAQVTARPLELEEIVCLAIDALIQGNIVNRARGLARNGVGRAGGAHSHGACLAAGRAGHLAVMIERRRRSLDDLIGAGREIREDVVTPGIVAVVTVTEWPW